MSRIGLNCKLYRNTATGANAYTTPTWVELTNVRDVTIPMTKAEADTSRRGSTWKTRKGTLKDASIDFQLMHDDGDTGFAALLDSYVNGTPIDMLALDGAINDGNAQGLRATVEVFNFQPGQPLEGAVMYDVSCKPCPAKTSAGVPITPVWYDVPGAP